MSETKAVIQQLVGMPDKWQFCYLTCGDEDEPELQIDPVLGLALVDITAHNDRVVVYFGMSRGLFQILYSPDGSFYDCWPFVADEYHRRALGVIPVTEKPEVWFGEDIERAVAQLKAEQVHHVAVMKYVKAAGLRLLCDEDWIALDNFFQMHSGERHYSATAAEWEQTLTALDEIFAREGAAGLRAAFNAAGRNSQPLGMYLRNQEAAGAAK